MRQDCDCKHKSITHRSKILAIKQALQLSPFVLWMDLDSLFLRCAVMSRDGDL